jgi:hypothetical protein
MRTNQTLFLSLILLVPTIVFAQADNEIQVYASPTVGDKLTIFELHSNYTFKGPKTFLIPNQRIISMNP